MARIAVLVLVAGGVAGGLLVVARPAAAALTSESDESVLVEKERALDVRVDGLLAQVTERVRLQASKAGTYEAVLDLSLPGDAAVTGLVVELPSGKSATALVMDARSAATPVVDPEAVEGKADLALLRRVDAGAGARADAPAAYELRVYPVDKKGVQVRVSWVAPLRYADGRLSLRLPAHGGERNLADAKVALDITPPEGAGGFGEVWGGGARLGKNTGAGPLRYAFDAPAERDVIVEATPWFGDDQPRASFAHAAIDEGSGAFTLSLLAPPARAAAVPSYERVLLVVDVSRSMSEEARLAANHLCGAALDAAGKQARVEAIVFDRTARRVMGEWVDNDHKARRKLELALAPERPKNGSDAGAALDLVGPVLAEARQRDRTIIEGGPRRTLLLLVSDAIAPIALDADRALDRLDDDAETDLYPVHVTVYPQEAPAPGATASALGAMAARLGGRALIVRETEGKQAAKRLAGELAQPPPLTTVYLDAGAALLEGVELPGELAPGSGVIVSGRYRGALDKVKLEGQVGGDPVVIAVERARGTLARAAAPLYASGAGLERFGAPSGDGDDDGSESDPYAAARRKLVRFASQAPAVTWYTSLVAMDPDDKFSRERAAFVEKWGGGVYLRLPPAPEREAGHAIAVVTPPAATAPNSIDDERDLPLWRRGRLLATGDLDKAIVRRVVRAHVILTVKHCYDVELRANDKLGGSLDMVFEVARGEVTFATVEKSTFKTSTIDQCVIDAAYGMDFPRVATGDVMESISLVRYPLVFQVIGQLQGQTGQVTDEGTAPPVDDKNDPLGGMDGH